MKIKCLDGPLHGSKVKKELGLRWPYVLVYEYGDPDILVGFYELKYGNDGFGYYWDSKIEQWHIARLAS